MAFRGRALGAMWPMHHPRHLKSEDQDLLLTYYLLSKAQQDLGTVFAMTQTVASYQLWTAIKTLGFVLQMDGEPTAKKMRPLISSEKFRIDAGLKFPERRCFIT